MAVHNLPINSDATASETLIGASRRPFSEVLVVGYYEDGGVRSASTMTRERELWILELRKLELLGLIDGAAVPAVSNED